MNEAYREAAAQLEKDIRYLAKAAGLKPGATMVLGCSTSEVAGGHIGKNSVLELGDALAETMIAVCGELGLHPVFQCCEHLNRALVMEQALLDPKQSVKLTQTTKNIMSVNVPVYDFQTQTRSDADIYPYGFAATSGELDTAVDALGKVFRKMLKLAEVEKSAQLMAEEIEKTRRRVNALEYVVIPNTQDAIRYITMKLDENDRATTTRLMKVKDMLLQQSIEEQRQRDAEVLERFREA